MRIISMVLLGLSILFPAAMAKAACGSDAIGTSRTIRLDPARVSSVHGKEKGLGLQHREVILTFDDGPVPGSSERILDTLADNCVKATFFSVGRMARAHPQITRRIVNEGHTLGHHTHDHERLPAHSASEAARYVESGISLVQKAAYGHSAGEVKVPFFRYPYLAHSSATDAMIRAKGLISFGANIDSLDWKKDAPATIVERVMTRLAKEGRGIVLMHDIHNRTATALPMLLDRLNSEGYRIVHVMPENSDGMMMASAPAQPKWEIRKTREIYAGFIIVAAHHDADSGQRRRENAGARQVLVKVHSGLAPRVRDWVLRAQL